MELSFYARILKRWFLLIAAGTLLAIALGLVFEYKSKIVSGGTSYRGTANTVILSATPPGTYVPGVSISTAANELVGHIHDPGATQVNARISASASSLSAFINPTTGAVEVQATASSPSAAREAANVAARYLAHLEDGAVKSEAAPDIKYWRKQALTARKNWLRLVRKLSHTPRFKVTRRAILGNKVSFWENQYSTARGNIAGFVHPAVPAASVVPATKATKLTAKSLSPLKTVVPAAIIGLVLSFLLAALLESRNTAPNEDETGVDEYPAVAEPVVAEQPVAVPVAAQPSEPTEPEQPSFPYEPTDRRTEMLVGMAEPVRQTAELVSRLVDSSRPSIFVTSPNGSEPKSETAAGLATALALSGKRVVLVDADPDQHLTRFFGLNDKPGLTDFLGYPEGSLQQLVYPANFSATNGSLWILPYGMRRLETAPLVLGAPQTQNADAWQRTLEQLASAGVLIVVDGPAALERPVLMDSAGAMGGVLVALERERTGTDVMQTYDILRARGAKLLGVVANPTKIRVSQEEREDSSGPSGYNPISATHTPPPPPRNPWVTGNTDPFSRT